jgi:hypothetical protein
MRRVLMALLVVALFMVATEATASAAAVRASNSPVTINASDLGPSQPDFVSILKREGFMGPSVFFQLGTFQDVLVVFDGGGPPAALAAIRQIEFTIWGVEPLRFDRLIIRSGTGAPVVVSYDDLRTSLGPRPAGFDAQPLNTVASHGGEGALLFAVFSSTVEVVKIAVIIIGVVLAIAILALGLGSVMGSRARAEDDAEPRLFA